MTNPTPTTAQRDEAIIEHYLAGETLAVIGERHGITRERVRQILANHGVKRRSHRQNASVARNQLVSSYTDQINRAFDLSHSISQVVHQYKGVVPARLVRDILAPRRHEQRLERPSVKRFSDDAILDALRSAEKDGATSVNSYRTWRGDRSELPSVALITVRFGSWSQARQQAGVTIRRAPRATSRVFSDADIDAALDRFAQACLSRGVNPSALGYDTWAKTVGKVPTLSTVRARTNRTWSSLMSRRIKAGSR